jgi:hypothetical protein
MGKRLKQFMKISGVLLCAFIMLNVFCFFYFNPTVHYPTLSRATDYAWEPDAFYSGGMEGFAAGHTDKLGYINDRAGGAIDGLIMGSSHMEAKNVSRNGNTVAQLNAMYGGELHFYNIGISGHDFLRCVRNARDAAMTFQPRLSLIIETNNVEFDYEAMNAVIDGTYPYLESYTGGIIGFLQRFPFLRRIYWQYQSYHEMAGNGAVDGGGQFGWIGRIRESWHRFCRI